MFLGLLEKKLMVSFFEFIRTNVHLNVQIKEELSETEQTVYNLLSLNQGISKAEISERISKSEKTVQRIIADLLRKGLIRRVGSNKSGYWEIIE